MDEYISRKAAIAYIREQSEECQKAFEELGGESVIKDSRRTKRAPINLGALFCVFI